MNRPSLPVASRNEFCASSRAENLPFPQPFAQRLFTRDEGLERHAERVGKRGLAQARFRPPQAQPRSNVAINGARKTV